MNSIWKNLFEDSGKSFESGFFGAFELAASIILAVASVLKSFVNDGDNSSDHQTGGSVHG